MPACINKFVILVLMDDERKGMKLGEYIEERIEANAKVSRLRKLPKLSEMGCEGSDEGRWKGEECVECES
jgi:hypothetical protein